MAGHSLTGAVIGSAHIWILAPGSAGGALTAAAFRRVGLLGLTSIVLAILIAIRLPETGKSRRALDHDDAA